VHNNASSKLHTLWQRGLTQQAFWAWCAVIMFPEGKNTTKM
jgi:hypothetical protein